MTRVKHLPLIVVAVGATLLTACQSSNGAASGTGNSNLSAAASTGAWTVPGDSSAGSPPASAPAAPVATMSPAVVSANHALELAMFSLASSARTLAHEGSFHSSTMASGLSAERGALTNLRAASAPNTRSCPAANTAFAQVQQGAQQVSAGAGAVRGLVGQAQAGAAAVQSAIGAVNQKLTALRAVLAADPQAASEAVSVGSVQSALQATNGQLGQLASAESTALAGVANAVANSQQLAGQAGSLLSKACG